MAARLSWPGYSKVIALMIRQGSIDWTDIVRRGWVSQRYSAAALLFDLRQLRLAHIDDWVHDADKRSRRPRYAFGEGVDAPCPGPARQRKRLAPRPELIIMANIIRALMTEPHNGKTLAEATGLHSRAARAAIRALRAESLVYIESYQDRGRIGHGYPLYKWGPGQQDAGKPRAKRVRNLWARANAERSVRTAVTAVMHALAGTRRISSRQMQRGAEKLRVAVTAD